MTNLMDKTKHEDEKLVIAISSRALFNMIESHQIYEGEGVEAYCEYQVSREDEPLEPGVAYELVKKLLALNKNKSNDQLVEVILLSRNSADTGLRVFNSINHHSLSITRAAFTSGASTHPYLSAFGTHLFLSADENDVRLALQAGDAAATILPSNRNNNHTNQVRIAFDGDSVIFSDEAELVFQSEGLNAFEKSEKASAKTPLSGGPFKKFLYLLHKIQSQFPIEKSPIRTALVTARGAPAHERAIRTLRDWEIHIDEVIFLGGMKKGPFLKAFGADIFFDDQQSHCESAREYVATGHVPCGVKNN
jgi:5'-nucleotidase